ncbi:unnamed protein product [Alopecurus aequalis]
MASRGGYDGGGPAGGKVRRRPAPRAAAASPYARPVASTVPAARGGEGSSGWITRLITGSASRLLSSVLRKPPPQLAAPPLPEPFDAPPTRLESLDALHSQPELLDAPPSLTPPPLEDAILEGEGNGGQTTNNLYTDNPENSVKDGDGMLIRSDCLRGMELDELLKQMTFTRSEFEYLAGLLQSRTVGYNTLQAEVSNIKQTRSSEKENGSRGLPVDFSIRSYSVADQVASPAEIAKAYMGSICPEGSPLRLRLHDPSTLTNKLVEASTVAKSPNPPLFRSSRLSASTPFDRLGSNYMTPNKSAIHKISSSPYFKGPVPSRDMSGTVSSSYQTSNSVHTFGRQQILKRKSIALNNETVSVGPIRKMRQRYNRVSPLLETRPGYRGYLGSHASKLDEDSEHSTQIQKRQCLAKVDNDTRGACGNTFGQAPPQSTEMAAKILKQLDTLAPSQKEGTSEIKQRHRNAIDVDDSNSQRKEILSQCSVLKSTSALNQEYSVLNSVNVAAKFTPAAIDGKSVDAISERSTVLESKSSSELVTSPEDSLEVDNCSRSIVALHQSKDTIEKIQPAIQEHTAKSPGTTNKDNPPTLSLQSHSPNLVLSSEIDRSVMSASSNGFSFPVTAALGAHSQAPPTPTMASPPTLAVGKDKSAGPSLPVTSAEGAPWISKQVSEEGSVSNKHVKKLNGEIPPISSKSAGHMLAHQLHCRNSRFNLVSRLHPLQPSNLVVFNLKQRLTHHCHSACRAIQLEVVSLSPILVQVAH